MRRLLLANSRSIHFQNIMLSELKTSRNIKSEQNTKYTTECEVAARDE